MKNKVKTTEQMISVMQAWNEKKGVESNIEVRQIDSDIWRSAEAPYWNWGDFDYRLKERPMEDQILYFHSRPELSMQNFKYHYDESGSYNTTEKFHPRVTICGIIKDEKMSVGVSVCSAEDTFVKKIGRNNAYERAFNKPIATLDLKNKELIGDIGFPTKDLIYFYFRDIAENAIKHNSKYILK